MSADGEIIRHFLRAANGRAYRPRRRSNCQRRNRRPNYGYIYPRSPDTNRSRCAFFPR